MQAISKCKPALAHHCLFLKLSSPHVNLQLTVSLLSGLPSNTLLWTHSLTTFNNNTYASTGHSLLPISCITLPALSTAWYTLIITVSPLACKHGEQVLVCAVLDLLCLMLTELNKYMLSNGEFK